MSQETLLQRECPPTPHQLRILTDGRTVSSLKPAAGFTEGDCSQLNEYSAPRHGILIGSLKVTLFEWPWGCVSFRASYNKGGLSFSAQVRRNRQQQPVKMLVCWKTNWGVWAVLGQT